MSRRFLAACIQAPVHVPAGWSSFEGVVQRNVAEVARAAAGAMDQAGKDLRLILFPTQPFSGGSYNAWKTWAEQPPMEKVALDLESSTLDPLRMLCRQARCYIGFSIFERTRKMPGHCFHTAVLLGPEGVVLRVPKTQGTSIAGATVLRDALDKYVAAFGESAILPVAETEIGWIGTAVERELHATEIGRLLTAKGAEIVLQPTANVEPGPDALAWRAGFAYANSVYLLSASPSRRLAEDGTQQWTPGSSSIVGPDGKVLGSIGGAMAEGSVIAPIDLDQLREVRERQRNNTVLAPSLRPLILRQTGRE
ncbi:nitrilase-related carbon-nitrogen hydrolase [Sphingomonas soli]|uniref:nitrilase-related carbon-nitrogen hydrolase n=1 Tax=Sphingomonas soli TaxID=266127 RepID=UPI00082EE9C0|nr:nitrilase-related carbon-nitrogen hydrolase [Sphingomonas soli]